MQCYCCTAAEHVCAQLLLLVRLKFAIATTASEQHYYTAIEHVRALLLLLLSMLTIPMLNIQC
jgi:hypothetical protein